MCNHVVFLLLDHQKISPLANGRRPHLVIRPVQSALLSKDCLSITLLACLAWPGARATGIISTDATVCPFVYQSLKYLLSSLKEMNAIVKKTGEVFRLIGCTIIDDLTTA